MTDPGGTAPGTRETAAPRSLGPTRPRHGERVIQGLLFLAGLLSVAVTVGIVGSLLVPTVEFFGEVSWREFLLGTEWTPLFNDPQYGVLPLLAGTLMITGIALVVAVPLGLASAIYLSEYARPGVRKVVKPALEVLAGIPTVVYGFFALSFVTPLLDDVLPFDVDVFNAASAGLVMGVMIVPTVASLSEDAMSAVPASLRDAGYALGSSRMVVALRIVVPAALSGIVAAAVLGVSRAIGETMIVTVAAGGRANLTGNPFEGMQTMTAFIAQAGSGDLPVGSLDYKTVFAVGALLFVITFAMNLVSIRMVRRFREVYE